MSLTRFAKFAIAAVAGAAFVMQTQLTSYAEKQLTTSSCIKGLEAKVGQGGQLEQGDGSGNVKLSPEEFKKELAAAQKLFFDTQREIAAIKGDIQKINDERIQFLCAVKVVMGFSLITMIFLSKRD